MYHLHIESSIQVISILTLKRLVVGQSEPLVVFPKMHIFEIRRGRGDGQIDLLPKTKLMFRIYYLLYSIYYILTSNKVAWHNSQSHKANYTMLVWYCWWWWGFVFAELLTDKILPLPEVFIMQNLGNAANGLWSSLEPRFRLCWITLCHKVNHYTTCSPTYRCWWQKSRPLGKISMSRK